MYESFNSLAYRLAEIAVLAAKPILDIYQRPITTIEKSDGSPVTEADLAADQLIRHELLAKFPDVEIVSEESFSPQTKRSDRFFLVDPLDGTKEFIKKTGEFTVNIAYIENGKSKAGAIFAPALSQLFFGGESAARVSTTHHAQMPEINACETFSTRDADKNNLVALASLSHRDAVTESFLHKIAPQEIKSSGSSYKFCVVASGNADIYPRVGPTMGWDTAAGQAILQAAGGAVIDKNGSEMAYHKPSLLNGPFLAVGDKRLVSRLVPIFVDCVRDQPHAKSDVAAKTSP